MGYICVPEFVKYTKYKDSVLATKVDKFCHSTNRIPWVSLISMILTIYYYMCIQALRLPAQLSRVLIGIVAGCFLIELILGFGFLGILCDKCKISARIAAWDIGGRKVSRKMKLWCFAIAAVLLLPGIAALIAKLIYAL